MMEVWPTNWRLSIYSRSQVAARLGSTNAGMQLTELPKDWDTIEWQRWCWVFILPVGSTYNRATLINGPLFFFL